MLKQQMVFQKLATPLLLLFFLLFFGNLLAAGGAAAELQDNAAAKSSVHATLSAMSDEQVRQLLIDELQKDAIAASESFSLEPDFTGPGAPLARILKTLNDESAQSENRLRKLLTGTPNLLPDLYKVFISL
ncbi:MAG: hypothetical protein GY799_34435 [Desulfobulbaceae bacterium]|nr:hypothetical protein [Desulfobulbaceae bacterium]